MQSIELFAGAGGLGIGLSRAGFQPIAVIEQDKYCRDTILENRKNIIEPVAHWPSKIAKDVRDFVFSEYEGKIELISGGPPCQPFSLGGKHKAHKDHRDLFSEAVRAVRDTKPLAFIFENVKGLTRSSFSNYLEYILLQLQHPDLARKKEEDWPEHLRRLEIHHTSNKKREDLEYRVVWNVLNAADYGVPQRRERVFFVGFRGDLGVEWTFPLETHSQDALLWEQCHDATYWDRNGVPKHERIISDRLKSRARRIKERPRQRPWRTVRDQIGDLPDPEFQPQQSAEFRNHIFQPGARSYPGHTGSPLDEPAKTLKAGVHGVPGGENMLLKPSGEVRYFTVRESARLQTFTDDYAFHGSWTETMRQLGNAVPVELAEIIAQSVGYELYKLKK